MSTPSVENPFVDQLFEEVQLQNAPLVHVVAQVRFQKILSLVTEEGVAPIQSELRRLYPVLNQDKTVGVLLSPEGMASQQQNETVWRLKSKESSWQVSIGTSFISLDTSEYVTRTDFIARFYEVLSAFGRAVESVIVERIGMRYVNRIDSPEQFARLEHYVRPEVLGGRAVPLSPEVSLLHSICETVFVGPEHQLLTRWGIIPPNAVLDPSFQPSPLPSWLLDLDIFRNEQTDFEADALIETFRRFAEQAYRFFLWTMTDTFITEVGMTL